MALKLGTLLGPYEVLSQLGAGGMGEVYKGRDTRLERLVALKVLAPHLADHPEAHERFEREARAVANLKHPHICVLYDIGKDKDRDFLVLEYLEGETLAQRLAKGPLSLEQLLQYATEVSDALDKAHRAGVTHRDIKPGNIMLVPQSGSGPRTSAKSSAKTSTKLLDFGLAKLKQEVVPNLPRSEWPTGMGAPTVQGTILGMPHYMAPEQAEGKVDELDPRTDIFSFGATVYEMVTGKKAFDGQTPTSVIAKVLEVDPPPMSSLKPLTPPALNRVVRKCLRKAPEERWQNARDVNDELEWIKESGAQALVSEGVGVRAAVPTPVAPRRRLRERLPWIAAVVFLIAFLAALPLVIGYFRIPRTPESPVRFTVPAPEGTTYFLGETSLPMPAISPDGRRLAFVSMSQEMGRRALWIRSFDSLSAQMLPGTQNAVLPFWSPDSRYIGFFADGKLKKVEVTGGPPQVLCDAADVATTGVGGTWNRDGIILFNQGEGLSRVSAAGGEPTPVMKLDRNKGDYAYAHPQFLPDGRHFLYLTRNFQLENEAIYVGSLDSGESVRPINTTAKAMYSAGHLLFLRGTTLMAQQFDVGSIQLAGEPFPVAEQVTRETLTGRAAFGASENGMLAFRSSGATSSRQLVWFDRGGKQVGDLGPPGAYVNPKVSPDGQQVAVEIAVGEANSDIWLLDLSRGVPTRFTSDSAHDYYPLWSPDGSRIVFASSRGGAFGLYQKSLSGAGKEEPLLKPDVVRRPSPYDWSADGRFLLIVMPDPRGGPDLWTLPMSGDRKPVPYLQRDFGDTQGQFSPNGKCIAYTSSESGGIESFPTGGGKVRVSSTGAVQPRWRRDGRELLYIASDQKLMAVSVKADSTVEAGPPTALFQTRMFQGPISPFYRQQYDVTADGQRFLINVPEKEETGSPLTVVLNWTAGLKKQ